MTPRKPVRVRKARRSSRLACGCYVLTGEQITSRGAGWSCLPCAGMTIPPVDVNPQAGAPRPPEGKLPPGSRVARRYDRLNGSPGPWLRHRNRPPAKDGHDEC